MTAEPPRAQAFAKDARYEALLERVNAALAAGRPRGPSAPPERPLVAITGLPRSGTTLLYQALAASGCFGYASNLIARFHADLAFGAQVQAVASAWLPRGPMSFSSRAGNTSGWFEPHECGYFWQRHFPFHDHHEPDEAALARVDGAALAAELGALERELELPLAIKNVILVFVGSFLARELPTLRFARIRRPHADVARSLLRTRQEFYGTPQAWFSVRPRDAADHAGASPEAQVQHQIDAVERALAATRAEVGPTRWLELDYADLCAHPRDVVAQVAAFAETPVDPATLTALPDRFRA
jgi:hypothetical protein